MPNKLRGLRFDQAANLVDAPANPGAKIVLFKRASQPSVGAVHVDSPDWKKQDVDHFKTHRPTKPVPAASKAAAKEPPVSKKAQTRKRNRVVKRVASRIAALIAKDAEAGPLKDWASQEETEPAHKPGAPVPSGPAAPSKEADAAHKEAEAAHATMKAHALKLGEAIAAYGDTSKLSDNHPVHSLKALHSELTQKVAAHEAAMKEAEAHKQAEAEAEARKAAEAEAEADADAGDDDDDDDDDDGDGPTVNKRQVTQIQKQLVDLQKKADAAEKRAADAEKIAKGERELRELEGEKTVLRKFAHMRIDVEKEAGTFLKLRTSDKSLYDQMIAKLASSNEIVKKAEQVLAQDIGSDAHGGGASAWAVIEAEADKLVQKSDKPISREKAIDRVMKLRPDLVREYNAEKNGTRQ